MIRNITKGTVLAHTQGFCRDAISQGLGLMFRGLGKGHALVFEFNRPVKSSIHMFFVFYPIDILFLDENNKVSETVHNLKPFAFYNPRRRFCSFIELPASTLKTSGTEVGDAIAY